MAAGMHPAVRAGEFLAGGFLDRQSIHIGAQQNRLAGMFAAEQHHKACLTAGFGGQPHRLEMFLNNGKGIVQIKARLCVGVEFAAHRDHFGCKSCGLLHQLFFTQHGKNSFHF